MKNPTIRDFSSEAAESGRTADPSVEIQFLLSSEKSVEIHPASIINEKQSEDLTVSNSSHSKSTPRKGKTFISNHPITIHTEINCSS